MFWSSETTQALRSSERQDVTKIVSTRGARVNNQKRASVLKQTHHSGQLQPIEAGDAALLAGEDRHPVLPKTPLAPVVLGQCPAHWHRQFLCPRS